MPPTKPKKYKKRPTKIIRKPTGKPRRRFKAVAERAVAVRLPRLLVKSRQQIILELYASGKPIDQIALKLKMQRQHVTRDLNIAIQEMIEAFAKPTPQQTFVRYATFQLAVVRRLGEAIQAFKADKYNKQYNAWVSALRAQSDIYDKVYSKGLEYGVIKKAKADPKALQGSTDIRKELRVEIDVLSTLLDQIDDQTQRQGLKGRAIQSRITYAVRVRKPLRTEFGIARAIPDWKYRRAVYDSQGNEVPSASLSPDQQLLIPHKDPDHRLHQELNRHSQEIDNSEPPPTKPSPPQNEPTKPQPNKGRKHPPPEPTEQETWIVKPTQQKPPPIPGE